VKAPSNSAILPCCSLLNTWTAVGDTTCTDVVGFVLASSSCQQTNLISGNPGRKLVPDPGLSVWRLRAESKQGLRQTKFQYAWFVTSIVLLCDSS
jgi:hypothetical protein